MNVSVNYVYRNLWVISSRFGRSVDLACHARQGFMHN